MSALQGLLAMYGNAAGGGKAIIFVNTKAKADEVNAAVNEFAASDALHGDISQGQREKVRQDRVLHCVDAACVFPVQPRPLGSFNNKAQLLDVDCIS